MTRLFVSLYCLVVIGLIVIGWGSEQIWRAFNSESGQTSGPDQQVIQLLPLTLAHFDSEQALTQQLADIFGSQVNIISEQDIALPKAQMKALKQGQSIQMQAQAQGRMIYHYWQDKAKIIEIGPIQPVGEQTGLSQLLKLFSYLLLALVIALWTWPLWRDLRKLQSASQYFARGLFKHSVNVKKSSSIYTLAESFQAMAEQISQLMEEQKQLVNAVSHDLRTPLSRIKFSFGLLPEETLAQLPDVQQDINELEKLIDELLSYARLESQTQKLTLDEVDLHQLITHQVERFSQLEQTPVQVKVEPSLSWLCDGYLIERCISNLLSNALRYSRDKVVIGACVQNDYLMIYVEDDGPGVAPPDYQTIFKPFTRLETSRNKNSAGFGLGLAIVQKIAHWHKGDCFISKSMLGGARFAIKLPGTEAD